MVLERNLSPSTMNVRLSAIRNLLRKAKRAGVLGTEEASQIKGDEAPTLLVRHRRRVGLFVRLKHTGGEMYFCDLRCLCVWSVQLATRPNLAEVQRSGAYMLSTLTGAGYRFRSIAEIAIRAVKVALG